MLVLVHHTILAYCRYGHFNRAHYLWSSAPIVDPQRWIGFDILQDFNDTYFMSLMFLVSGLFVLPSLRRKGTGRYARDRICRLGLPFALCVTLIMPLAYYPSIRQTGLDLSPGQYWLGYFTRFGWPGGPAWFIWFLLALDLFSCALMRRWPNLPEKIAAVPDLIVAHPIRCFFAFLAMAWAVYLPAWAAVGPERWLSVGPFAVQENRVGLYTLFFATGVSAGAAGVHHRLFSREGPVARHWIGCTLLAGSAFGLLLGLQLASLRHLPLLSAPWWQAVIPLLFVLCCVASSMALAGLFIGHVERGGRWMDRLADSAYGIYLVHYVFLTWSQMALLSFQWGAVPKAAIVFMTVLLSSWSLTALLRRSRIMRAVL